MNILFVYTYIQTNIQDLMNVFLKCCKCSILSITSTFISWKRVNMSIAYMKQTAHQKHLKVCRIKNLKTVPLAQHLKVFYHWMEDSRLKITQKSFRRIVNPGQTQTTIYIYIYYYVQGCLMQKNSCAQAGRSVPCFRPCASCNS